MCAELQHTKARMKLKFLLSLFTFQRSSPFVRFYPKLHLRLSRRFLNARVVIPPVQRISLPCAIAHGLCRRPSALHQRLVGVRENRRWWLFQRFVSLRVIRTRKARIFFASLPWRAVLVRTAHRGNILRAHSPPSNPINEQCKVRSGLFFGIALFPPTPSLHPSDLQRFDGKMTAGIVECYPFVILCL